MAAAVAAASAAGFGGLGDIMDAFFGGAAPRAAAAAQPRRPAQDALIRIELDLDESASSASPSDLTVDTAVLCTTCTGAGTAPGTHPTTCDTCAGRGEVQSVQRSFLGQVVTAAALPGLPRLRRGHPEPVPPSAPATAGSARGARSP